MAKLRTWRYSLKNKLTGSATTAAANVITSAANAVTSRVRNIANEYRGGAVEPVVTVAQQPPSAP
jgi:hypothetical protein